MKKYTKARERLNTVLCYLLFFGPQILMIFEIDSLSNTIGGWQLFGISFAPGFVIGVAIARKFFVGLAQHPPALRLPVMGYVAAGFMVGLITSYVASNANRRLGNQISYTRSHKVLRKFTTRSKTLNYHLTLQLYEFPRTTMDVKSRYKFWKAISTGDDVLSTTYPGFLGFSVITKIQKHGEDADGLQRAFQG